MQLSGESLADSRVAQSPAMADGTVASSSGNSAKEHECKSLLEGEPKSDCSEDCSRDSPVHSSDWTSRSPSPRASAQTVHLRHLRAPRPTLLSNPGVRMGKATPKTRKAHGIQPPASSDRIVQDSRITDIVRETARHYGVSACLTWAIGPSQLRMGACHGLPMTALPSEHLPLDTGFELFHHHVDRDLPIIIADLSEDPRTSKHPLVTGAPRLRFYAAAPLKIAERRYAGTITIADSEPRDLKLTACDFLKSQAELLVAVLRELDGKPEDPMPSTLEPTQENQTRPVISFQFSR